MDGRREAGWWLGPQSHDFSGLLRERYDHVGLTEAQAGAVRWLSPNADLVNELLNVKDDQTWQSVPVAAFYTRDFELLYHYVEYPAIYHKDRLAAAMQVARATESREQAWERFIRDWGAVQQSPFFTLWASAAVDEILSALHERLRSARPSAEREQTTA